jgi:hypothetical protein
MTFYQSLNFHTKIFHKENSPSPIAKTSIGNEPRRLVNNTSESPRRDNSFLKRFQTDPVLLLAADSIDSLTIGVKISAPLEERRRRIFFGFRRFPLTLLRMATFVSHGIDPRRWYGAIDDDITGGVLLSDES